MSLWRFTISGNRSKCYPWRTTVVRGLIALYSGHDPSRLFHRSVNKRIVPDYYDIIKEPMALSILKQRINKREYKQFSEFVRDCALVRDSHSYLRRPD